MVDGEVLRIVRHVVTTELQEEGAVRGELLNSFEAAVEHVHVSGAVRDDLEVAAEELAVADTLRAEAENEIQARSEDLHAVVVAIADVHPPGITDRHAARIEEEAVATALTPIGAEMHARGGELLDPMVEGVGDPEIVVRVERHPLRQVELAVAGSLLAELEGPRMRAGRLRRDEREQEIGRAHV